MKQQENIKNLPLKELDGLSVEDGNARFDQFYQQIIDSMRKGKENV